MKKSLAALALLSLTTVFATGCEKKKQGLQEILADKMGSLKDKIAHYADEVGLDDLGKLEGMEGIEGLGGDGGGDSE